MSDIDESDDLEEYRLSLDTLPVEVCIHLKCFQHCSLCRLGKLPWYYLLNLPYYYSLY